MESGMGIKTLGLIVFSVMLSAFAQVSFKWGMSEPATTQASAGARQLIDMLRAAATPGVIGGLALYAIGTLLWLQVLSRVDLSQAYPFVGLGFVVTSVFGVLLFGEAMTAMRMAGILLVITGIYVIARS